MIITHKIEMAGLWIADIMNIEAQYWESAHRQRLENIAKTKHTIPWHKTKFMYNFYCWY